MGKQNLFDRNRNCGSKGGFGFGFNALIFCSFLPDPHDGKFLCNFIVASARKALQEEKDEDRETCSI